MTDQQQSALTMLRQLILRGEIKPGNRLAEIPTAERLGVSRTPVRIAFRTLEQEGLLEKLSGRGYRVRDITEEEIQGAIEVRGVLEGLAAMQVAERGLSCEDAGELRDCLQQGDALLEKGYVTLSDMETYQNLNFRFHSIIVNAANNPAITNALARNEHLPFASPTALAFDINALEREFKRIYFAHLQHHTAFDAIIHRQSARAEAIMREHANAGVSYAKLFVTQEKNGSIQVINCKSKSV